MNLSFARSYRLTKTDDFSSVFGFRRVIRGKLIALHYRPREPGMTEPRLGLVVGKKQLKRAVDRNTYKRVIREQFRLLRPLLPAIDLVVRLTVKPLKINRKIYAEEFLTLLKKLPHRLKTE
ncbi:MAG: ribonuclease P protein component [Rhodocyclaceae bacterium]|nr:ribonuclease P protein component [Rhodocyclaceae bacterium]